MTKVEIKRRMMVALLEFALGLGVVVPGSTYPSRALAKVSADKPEKHKKDQPVSVPEPFGIRDLLIVLALAGVGGWTLARFKVLRANFER
jgi:hypothetical protein